MQKSNDRGAIGYCCYILRSNFYTVRRIRIPDDNYFYQLTANVVFFRLLFHADARPTDPMFSQSTSNDFKPVAPPSLREKTNFPSEEHVIFTGNLFETINNLIFDIIYIKIGQDSC